MHLVVLRRNDVDLPEHLPPALMPYVPLPSDEPFAADLPPGSTLKHGVSPPHVSITPTVDTFDIFDAKYNVQLHQGYMSGKMFEI